ncbi:hypothetical protein YQE_05235, partial [Dendroctonus ponderosae]
MPQTITGFMCACSKIVPVPSICDFLSHVILAHDKYWRILTPVGLDLKTPVSGTENMMMFNGLMRSEIQMKFNLNETSKINRDASNSRLAQTTSKRRLGVLKLPFRVYRSSYAPIEETTEHYNTGVVRVGELVGCNVIDVADLPPNLYGACWLRIGENCQNYIRVMAKTAQSRLLLCGTNAFKPICREYNVLSRNYTFEKEKAGQALCPYDPRHNSTAIYVGKQFVTFELTRIYYTVKPLDRTPIFVYSSYLQMNLCYRMPDSMQTTVFSSCRVSLDEEKSLSGMNN